MIRIRDKMSTLALAAAAAAFTGAAGAAGSIKAAYVEQVIPSHTYFGHMTVVNATNSIGPGTGILGIGSITLTNFDASPQQVFIFVPSYSGDGCGAGGSTIIGGTTPMMTFYVQPNSTLHLPFPMPLVINPSAGNTCIGAEVTTLLHGGSVTMDVDGVVN
ncbi:MAG: hypothetical protein JF586_14470 [Burkholderiales bacterium]|nr:hypothetical protein [Burkholderiales bacterium]